MQKHVSRTRLCSPFRLSEMSDQVRILRSLLVCGEALAIEEVFADRARGFLVHVFAGGGWAQDVLFREASAESGLGAHHAKCFPVFQIGTHCPALCNLDESLEAGFTVYLLPSNDGAVVDSVDLIAPIADSS